MAAFPVCKPPADVLAVTSRGSRKRSAALAAAATTAVAVLQASTMRGMPGGNLSSLLSVLRGDVARVPVLASCGSTQLLYHKLRATTAACKWLRLK